MSHMKLISESHSDFNDIEVLMEQANPNKPKLFKIKGRYIVTEEKNANGRVYREDAMVEAVAEYQTNYIDKCIAYGQLNHPDHCDIDGKEVAHRVTSLTKEGNIWLGESVICQGSTNGDVVIAMLSTGGKIGISTRGVGNITKSGIVDKYKLICADIVTNPSGPSCYVDGILESKNYLISAHGDLMEVALNTMEKKLEHIPKHERNPHLDAVLKEFIKNIKL